MARFVCITSSWLHVVVPGREACRPRGPLNEKRSLIQGNLRPAEITGEGNRPFEFLDPTRSNLLRCTTISRVQNRYNLSVPNVLLHACGSPTVPQNQRGRRTLVASGAKGRRFESCQAYHDSKSLSLPFEDSHTTGTLPFPCKSATAERIASQRIPCSGVHWPDQGSAEDQG